MLCVLRPSIYFICIGLAVNCCGMYGDRRRVGLSTSRARADLVLWALQQGEL